MNDLRTEKLHLNPMDKKDIEEVYRELCVIHKMSIEKAKAFSNAKSGFSLYNLIKLAVHFNLRMELDAMQETMTIWHPEAGNPPVDIVLDEKTTKIIEENNPGLKNEEQTGNEELESFKYSEIKKDPLPQDDAEDLF